MARIDNATVMQCDRCGRNKWYKDSSGTVHDYLFCDQDYKDYVNKLKDFDNSFDSWMQNGGKQNG